MLSLKTPTGRRLVVTLACWLLCLYWFLRELDADDAGASASASSAGGSASSAWKARQAEAAAAAAAAAQARRSDASSTSSGGAPSTSSSSAASGGGRGPPASSVPHPGNPDGLQYHGAFGVSPSWPEREFHCPIPPVLPSEPERFKRISGLFRNFTATLPYMVHGWGATKAGWQPSGGSGSSSGNDSSAGGSGSSGGGGAFGAAPLPLLRVQSREVARFVGMQEDIIARYGVTMQVNNRFDVRLMSPAIVHIGGGRFLLFARVSCYPAELYDNLIWTQELDEALDPVPGTGGVIGVPTHSQFLMAPGPEDPRALIHNGDVLVLFNHQYRNDDRRMIIYNHAQKRLSELRVEGLTQTRAEKNWMPFTYQGQLHLIYQMTPLIIIRCELPSGDCVCVVPAGGCAGTKGSSQKIYSRGGTPLTQVGDHLFFGLLHSTYRFHMIRSHIVLLSTQPWGWVVLGGPLPMPEGLPGCYEGQVPWDVQFPASALLLGPGADALLMGIHVRDAMSALIHVDLGTPLVDVLAQVTEQACEEAAEGGARAMAPEAPEDMAAGTVTPSALGQRAWRTSDGRTFPACKRWAVMDSAGLDALIVPMLH